MKPRTISFIGVGLGVLIVASQVFGGTAGVVGLLVGLTMGAFGAFVLYQCVRMLREATRQSGLGVMLVLLMFFFKFPAIFLGAYFSLQQGMAGLVFFVVGVLVVYSALVLTALQSDLYPRGR